MILNETFDVNEKGHLTIAGLDSIELSQNFGTPAYYLDTDAVRRMCRIYRNSF